MDTRTHSTWPESVEEAILRVAGRFATPRQTSAADAWMLLLARMETVHLKKQVYFYSTIAFRVAASLVLSVVATFILYVTQEITVQTASGEIKTITLPDFSTVTLNAGSSLQYNALTFDFSRSVSLDGEALFVVKKGSSFIVESHRGSTQVLGTQFNVLARNRTYQVSCVEGKVQVQSGNSSVILTAGHQTKSLGKNLTSASRLEEKSLSWIKGEFFFENTPIAEVLETLELQYGIDVVYDEKTSRRYSGYFTNNDLDEALKLICLPLNLEYTVTGKVVRISSKHNHEQ